MVVCKLLMGREIEVEDWQTGAGRSTKPSGPVPAIRQKAALAAIVLVGSLSGNISPIHVANTATGGPVSYTLDFNVRNNMVGTPDRNHGISPVVADPVLVDMGFVTQYPVGDSRN